MAQDSDRSIIRLLLWEGLAAVGLVAIHLHPYANHIWNLNLFYNALFFLLAYPILYVYRWKVTEGCLATLLWPLSFALSWGLGISSYIWTAYILLLTGSPYFYAMTGHLIPLGILFAFIYFPLIQPLLGVGKNFQTLGQLLWMLISSALGGFVGYATGWYMSQKFSTVRAEHSHWLLLWLGLTFLGTALGALIAQRRGK
jgi:hypothetical protein